MLSTTGGCCCGCCCCDSKSLWLEAVVDANWSFSELLPSSMRTANELRKAEARVPSMALLDVMKSMVWFLWKIGFSTCRCYGKRIWVPWVWYLECSWFEIYPIALLLKTEVVPQRRFRKREGIRKAMLKPLSQTVTHTIYLSKLADGTYCNSRKNARMLHNELPLESCGWVLRPGACHLIPSHSLFDVVCKVWICGVIPSVLTPRHFTRAAGQEFRESEGGGVISVRQNFLPNHLREWHLLSRIRNFYRKLLPNSFWKPDGRDSARTSVEACLDGLLKLHLHEKNPSICKMPTSQIGPKPLFWETRLIHKQTLLFDGCKYRKPPKCCRLTLFRVGHHYHEITAEWESANDNDIEMWILTTILHRRQFVVEKLASY